MACYNSELPIGPPGPTGPQGPPGTFNISNLPVLETAASDDIMYIFDTSTNTSKQIEVQNIYNGMPQLESGVYIPTVSNQNNVTVSALDSYYSRVGDIVTVSFMLGVALDVGETSGSFELEPPIPIEGSKVYHSTMWYVDPSKLINPSTPSVNTIFGKIAIEVTCPTSGFNYQYLYITGQYLRFI